MTIEHNEPDHEPPYATSPTDHVLTELQLHGYSAHWRADNDNPALAAFLKILG
jgi:hypothetical protein